MLPAIAWPEVYEQLATSAASDRVTQALGLAAAVVFVGVCLVFLVITWRRARNQRGRRLLRSCLLLPPALLGGVLFSMPFWQSLDDPSAVVCTIQAEEDGIRGQTALTVEVHERFVLNSSGRGAALPHDGELRLAVGDGLASAVAVGDSLVLFVLGSGRCVGYLDAAERVVVPEPQP